MVEKRRGNYIDAHVHVWTSDVRKYPLRPGAKIQDMNPATFPPAEILRHARPSGVNRIVLVQMSFYGFDNSFMLNAIRKSPRVFRGIAVVDRKGKAPDVQMRKLA